ncbi:MAG: hypothetical protein ACFB4J_18800 [Elainellaceae cyanobacterium]
MDALNSNSVIVSLLEERLARLESERKFHGEQAALHRELQQRTDAQFRYYYEKLRKLRGKPIGLANLPRPLSPVNAESALAPSSRKPNEIRRQEFVGKRLADAIDEVLQASGETSIDELVAQIYTPCLVREVKRCKASLTSVLCGGIKAGRFVRVSEGMFRLADS